MNLNNEAIYVNGNDALAFEPGIRCDNHNDTANCSMDTGGLFNMKLEGSGMITITTESESMTLRATRIRG
ncbi:MAG TPA: hypothetical protein VK436_06265 [Methanocella sp.]|nr:hypothetical protein [Methanocella sp.]